MTFFFVPLKSEHMNVARNTKAGGIEIHPLEGLAKNTKIILLLKVYIHRTRHLI